MNLPGISSTQCAGNTCTQNALKTRQNNGDATQDQIEARKLREMQNPHVTPPTEHTGTRLNVQA